MRNRILELCFFPPLHTPRTSLGLTEAWSLVVSMCSTPTKLRRARLLWSLQPKWNRTSRQWNILVRTELMEKGWLRVYDPWGKRWRLFPCSMVCVKPKQMTFISGWTAGVVAPRLDARNEKKTRGKEWGWLWLSAEISHLLLQSSCRADELFWHLKAMSRLTSMVFPCSIILPLLYRNIWFLSIDLVNLSDLYFQSLPWNLFWDMIWSHYRTTWRNMTFIPNHLPGLTSQNRIIVHLILHDVALAPGLRDGGMWASISEKVWLCSWLFFLLRFTNVTEM